MAGSPSAMWCDRPSHSRVAVGGRRARPVPQVVTVRRVRDTVATTTSATPVAAVAMLPAPSGDAVSVPRNRDDLGPLTYGPGEEAAGAVRSVACYGPRSGGACFGGAIASPRQ